MRVSEHRVEPPSTLFNERDIWHTTYLISVEVESCDLSEMENFKMFNSFAQHLKVIK